jgi:hypothetical protein
MGLNEQQKLQNIVCSEKKLKCLMNEVVDMLHFLPKGPAHFETFRLACLSLQYEVGALQWNDLRFQLRLSLCI